MKKIIHQYTGRTSHLLVQHGTGLPSYANIGLTIYVATRL